MEMDGVGRGRGLWRNVKQRLGLKGIGFCGSSWSSLGLGASDMNLIREDADDALLDLSLEDQTVRLTVSGRIRQIPADTRSAPPCEDQLPEARASSGMNLATALAAERNVRPLGPTMGAPTGGIPNFTPLKSLMGLFEETDGEDRMRRKTEKRRGGGGVDAVCCVCMERNKGAAFIPCGHTYCRICSRELWMNRGACPLCNRPITEVLDIF